MSKAVDFLTKAADLMTERGKQYDQPEGERSMGKAVAAFNIVTGQSISEAEGWLLLQILKDVRQWQRPSYHADSAEDCVAYAALKAEALANGTPSEWLEVQDAERMLNEMREAEDVVIWPPEERIDVIGQNGPTAEHYEKPCIPCRMHETNPGMFAECREHKA